jgi:uncharacterized protein YqjF (DUF2071 family)
LKIQEILNTTNHRPWELPNSDWKFYQEWKKVIFLHWEVDLNELQKFVPKELEIDTFDGKPWVSLVAFTMENIRPKYLPSFSPISNFDEINIRTYVKANNKTGVYFLSIEGGKYLSCKIAKALSKLPYRYSKIHRSTNRFQSTNIDFDDKLDIRFKLGEKLSNKSKLDKWLTERYALFQDTDESINEFEIHHLEWLVNEVDLDKCELNYKRFNKLLMNSPDKIHYSKGVQVVAWGKNKTKKFNYTDT